MTTSGSSSGRFGARLFAWFSSVQAPPPEVVRERLLDTTYDRRFSVLFGTLGVLIIAVSAIMIADVRWPYAWIAADLVLLVIRLSLLGACAKARKAGTPPPFGQLMAASGIWSIVTGLCCYGCIASGEPALAVLAALYIAGVVGVVSSRNAATPRYAVFVMLAISLPFTFGALFVQTPGMFVVGIQMPFLIAGVVGVLLQNYSINVRMIRAELDNRSLAVTDALTGLPNRIVLQELLRDLFLAPAANTSGQFAVLSMDLDGFKQINDGHGHAVGDALLCKVAERLHRAMRPSDTVFRIGGDEFVALLRDVSEIEATYLAKRAIEKISLPFDLGVGVPLRVGLSVGSAFAPQDGTTPEALLAASDLALYEAKRTGKGRYRAHMRSVG